MFSPDLLSLSQHVYVVVVVELKYTKAGNSRHDIDKNYYCRQLMKYEYACEGKVVLHVFFFRKKNWKKSFRIVLFHLALREGGNQVIDID